MPNHTPFQLPERFWAKTRRDPSGCVIWTASAQSSGYGAFSLDGKVYLAHRLAYTAARGPIPGGWHIDHLCRVKLCVNPDHLEPVTALENNVRAVPFRRPPRPGIRRYRFVTHNWVDPVNGEVYSTHKDYPYWRDRCRMCSDLAA